MNIPTSHPRYASLKTRALLERGVQNGTTSLNGLIAHGRGEAFDYLLDEKTYEFAKKAIDAAAALLLLAEHPVISVNGNTAVLVPKELITLSTMLNAPLEVNLFHKSKERLTNIQKHLMRYGAQNVLLPENNCTIPYLESNRKYVNSQGIMKADVVFIPLEDGDRAQALIANAKKVITVDLNPLSRTAQKATITIVDNITRVMPALISAIGCYKNDKIKLKHLLEQYDHKVVLHKAVFTIVSRFIP